MILSSMTQSEIDSLFGMFLGIGLFIMFIVAIIGIFFIIVNWKLFKKAGYNGWEAIVPVYNGYILCKILGINFWIFMLGIPLGLGFVGGFLSAFSEGLGALFDLLTFGYSIFIGIWTSLRYAKAFGKDGGFAVGIMLLPIVFLPILAFGDAQYVGVPRGDTPNVPPNNPVDYTTNVQPTSPNVQPTGPSVQPTNPNVPQNDQNVPPNGPINL